MLSSLVDGYGSSDDDSGAEEEKKPEEQPAAKHTPDQFKDAEAAPAAKPASAAGKFAQRPI